MDWIKYFNELDVQNEIEAENGGITARIFVDGSKNKWCHKEIYFQNESERIVSYAIEDLKKNTMYLSNPALLEFIKETKGRKIENYIPQKNRFTKQAFFEANVIFKTFLDQLEKTLLKPEPEKLPTLEAIFQDKNDLKKLVELLTERGFCKVEAGRLTWTGIENGSETDRGRGLQLVALSKVCKPLYKTEVFTAKDLNQAWTKSFNYKMSAVKWQAGEVEKISDSYLRLFTFINHSFRIK